MGTRNKTDNITLRGCGDKEQTRIWSNEMPYCRSHGLSLCSGGLIEGIDLHGTAEFEWNAPIDDKAVVKNVSRDIEKMFRELKLLYPQVAIKNKLPGETFLNMFQNTASYSTIPATQHLHIACGTLEHYPIYNLSNKPTQLRKINAEVDLVKVGNDKDAMFLKVEFSSLTNEKVIDFLIKLNIALLNHFDWQDNIDIYIHLLPTGCGNFVFICEPHIRLEELDDRTFKNTDTGEISKRRPQINIPQGTNIKEFEDEMSKGLGYIQDVYDATAKQGVYDFINEFIKSY